MTSSGMRSDTCSEESSLRIPGTENAPIVPTPGGENAPPVPVPGIVVSPVPLPSPDAVEGLGLRVKGLGFWAPAGSGVWGLVFRVWGLGFTVWGLGDGGFRAEG